MLIHRVFLTLIMKKIILIIKDFILYLRGRKIPKFLEEINTKPRSLPGVDNDDVIDSFPIARWQHSTYDLNQEIRKKAFEDYDKRQALKAQKAQKK